jgi:hypothetical protein
MNATLLHRVLLAMWMPLAAACLVSNVNATLLHLVLLAMWMPPALSAI